MQQQKLDRYLDQIDGLRDVYRTLQQIELARDHLQQLAVQLERVIDNDRSLTLYEVWRMYRANGGGPSARQFEDFLPHYFKHGLKQGRGPFHRYVPVAAGF